MTSPITMYCSECGDLSSFTRSKAEAEYQYDGDFGPTWRREFTCGRCGKQRYTSEVYTDSLQRLAESNRRAQKALKHLRGVVATVRHVVERS